MNPPFLVRACRASAVAWLLAVSAILAACGGDSDSPPPPPPCYYTYSLTGSPVLLPGADPLLREQWHLDMLGVQAVWDEGNKGDGVRVAVVDDAVETVHQDLWPNANGSMFDYRSYTATAPLPCNVDDDHGTAVSGIILSRDLNAVGGAGVAPRATLSAFNALATPLDSNIADALTRDNAAVAIYNNSWGSPDNGVLNPAEATFASAILRGIQTGRGGLGSIYVFPGGNGGCYLVDEFDQCAADENSNYDGYVNRLGVIAACAVGSDDRAPFYAEPGANILVCGPSSDSRVAITTNAPLSRYRSDFGGTSASTPMVSGVAALMLKERPDLSWRDVRLILAKSARQNSPFDVRWAPGAEGLVFHPYYGFGVADAQAAVALARTWNTVGGWNDLKSCAYTRNVALNIGDLASLSSSIDASACGISRIEFVEITFTATHTYPGDLRIELTSPLARTSVLAETRVCSTNGDQYADDCGSYRNGWTFGSVRHLEESSKGTWTLTVTDGAKDDTGFWTGWSIKFWGR